VRGWVTGWWWGFDVHWVHKEDESLPGHYLWFSIRAKVCVCMVSYASLVCAAGIGEAVGCSAGYCADLLARF
jgi:hypothetical protein